jgi:hypothetical protein
VNASKREETAGKRRAKFYSEIFSPLADDVGSRLPREYWEKIFDLMRETYSRGIHDAVTAIQDHRKSGGDNLRLFAELMESPDASPYEKLRSLAGWGEVGMIYPHFESELLRMGRRPPRKPGRKRLDRRAEKIAKLKSEGESWSQIALQLSRESGRSISKDAVRRLHTSRKKSSKQG